MTKINKKLRYIRQKANAKKFTYNKKVFLLPQFEVILSPSEDNIFIMFFKLRLIIQATVYNNAVLLYLTTSYFATLLRFDKRH